ncbi:MAG: proteasome assembly chaperone family protein [Candidatus Hodarchaeota archaeon]
MEGNIPIIKVVKVKEFSETIRKLKDPICIHGMPGMGMTGKTVLDQLIKELEPNLKKICEIYSTAFPANVIIQEDGSISPPKITIYAYLDGDKERKNDLILITGETQPNSVIGTNNLTIEIVKILNDLDVKLLISLAATPVMNPKSSPTVYITVTSSELIEEFKKAGVRKEFISGVITGMNGIMPGLAKFEYGIDGCALLAETYPQFGKDINASISLIKILNNYLNLNIQTTDLEERARKIEDLYRSLMDKKKRREKRQKKKDLGYIS